MLGVGKSEQTAVWNAEGNGFLEVFVKICSHVSTSCEEKNLPCLNKLLMCLGAILIMRERWHDMAQK